MHALKTGALIRAAVRLGALAAEAPSEATLALLDRYACAIGLAFQVQDDILDDTADTATLGKPQGADRLRDKPTFTSLLGIEGARAYARTLIRDAREAMAPLGPRAAQLDALARYVIERGH
jgi:farnesyl diphosphate synthase/geranylgeranyl diphosphate synthase type II